MPSSLKLDEARTLLQLALLLRRGSGDIEAASLLSPTNWAQLIQLADAEEVTSLLYIALQAHTNAPIPRDLSDYCALYHRLNYQRNLDILAVAREVIAASEKVGARCVLMKGAALLAAGGDGMLGAWTMRDLDILVPAELADAVATSLLRRGYLPLEQQQDWLHHGPPLVHPKFSITVEIHRDVGMQRHLIPVADAFAGAQLCPSGSTVLSPTHQILHNCFNAQVQDRAFELGRIPLKALAQVDWLVRSHSGKIDWNEFWSRSKASRMATVARAHMLLVRHFFATPMPPVMGGSPLRARMHLARCIAQLHSPLVNRLFRFWRASTPDLTHAALRYRFGGERSRSLAIVKHFARRAGLHGRKLPGRVLWVWRTTGDRSG